MRTVDVICPVFQEEEVINLFHGRLRAVLESIADRYAWRILYVVDPSSDQTERILSSIASADSRVEVLVLSRRFGHQAALIAGMDYSASDAVVMLDSDLQHPPELIPELVRQWEDGAEIVQTVRQDRAETGWLKHNASNLFYKSFSRIGVAQLQPGAADYRLLSARIIAIFRAELREHNPFLRGLVGWVGYRIVYVPFIPDLRVAGRSKYGPTTLVNFAFNGFCSFSKVPLRWCIAAGFAMAALSILSGFIQVFAYLLSDYVVPGWASLISAVSLIGGIQLLFLGVLGEYVSLIIDEVKDRPRYLVDKHHGQKRSMQSEPQSGSVVTCSEREKSRQQAKGATA